MKKYQVGKLLIMSMFKNLSIKFRLIILCIIPTVIICWGAYYWAEQTRARLSGYADITLKVSALEQVSALSTEFYRLFTLRNQSKLISEEQRDRFTKLTEKLIDELKPYQGDLFSSVDKHVVIANLNELSHLVQQLNQVHGEDLSAQSMWGFDLMYEILAALQKQLDSQVSPKTYQLSAVFDYLSWFLYWVEREAWLMQDIRLHRKIDVSLRQDYFEAIARQQSYLDNFVNFGATGLQLEQITKLLSKKEFQRSGMLRDKIMRGQIEPEFLEQYINDLESQQNAIYQLFAGFSVTLSKTINQYVKEDKRSIQMTFAAIFLILCGLMWISISTSYRISSKLDLILQTMNRLNDKKSKNIEPIAVDGNDEFSRFIQSLNEIIQQLSEHEACLIQAKEEAIAANRAKSVFLANMSHEIRTPLNGIVGLTEILTMNGLKPGQRDIIADIETSSQTLLILINDILDLSKIESGRLTISSHTFNLKELVYDTVNLMKSNAVAQFNELQIKLDANLPDYVMTDEFRLKQILTNLLSNATKFTQEGYITTYVSFDADNSRLMFRVADTGIGIDAQKLPTIFELFRQEDDSITRRYGGTGLGLPICKQLLDLMNGSLDVESIKGKGSSFAFSLPVELPRQSSGEVINFNVDALLISNKSIYTQNIQQDSARMGIRLSTVESIQDIDKRLHQKPDFVLYCPCLTRSANREITELRLIYSESKIMICQHHLFMSRELINLADMNITLPFLGVRFEAAVRDALVVMSDLYDNHASKDHPGRAGTRILVVEDNLMNQKIASFFLDKADYEYTVVNNGQEALDVITQGGQYNAILMDCMMPVMDGLTATRKIRSWEIDNHHAHIPIIALTASVLDEDIEKCYEAGMDAYLPKPYKSEQLLKVFNELQVYSTGS
ncbi:Signal transduction histidine-protein kinase BarA [Vibrio quintilis]|uniref:Sensory/regulatory protein RpfC n=1 Tax=Vibrio quintilis TaxID=1117707 RepID=A0A1M7Z1R7_9VIBR|nr:Signal transduction histidine-protein kinase BarA [Vibrio quintilis]